MDNFGMKLIKSYIKTMLSRINGKLPVDKFLVTLDNTNE